jgi:NAD(P)-dependent dehydrogenase (short-subunit alcohol dehydrogenase family)
MIGLNSLMNLTGRRALITGATGNLGREFCMTLAELGSDLVLVDLDEIKLTNLATEIMSLFNVRVNVFCCDLENEKERENLISLILSDEDELNILINNAAFVGTSTLTGWSVPFEQQSIATWRRAIEVNLTAVFHLSQGLSPKMKNSKGASIINISSIYGQNAPDWEMYTGTQLGNPAGYAASKGGLDQLTKWLSSTLSPNVRVNAVSPGGIFRNQPKEFVDKYVKKVQLGRMANESDFVGVITFLSSDMSGYVTGQLISIDGGFNL